MPNILLYIPWGLQDHKVFQKLPSKHIYQSWKFRIQYFYELLLTLVLENEDLHYICVCRHTWWGLFQIKVHCHN